MPRKPYVPVGDRPLVDALFAGLRKGAATKERDSNTAGDKAGALRRSLLPHQAALEADPARRVATRSARRAGKSTGMLRITCLRCVEHPASRWVVVGLTRPSIKEIFWADLLVLNEQFELGIHFQHQELTAVFPNGSRVRFVGADNVGEIEKLRGGHYDGVVIDECKSFGPALFKELLEEVIEPALLDRHGVLYLIGTPGEELRGPFYLATCRPPVLEETPDGSRRMSNRAHDAPDDPACPAVWSLHVWPLSANTTPAVNPKTGETQSLWEGALKVKSDRGWPDTHPSWRREYLGEWVAEDRRHVYRYRPHAHDYLPQRASPNPWGIPAPEGTEFKRVIGFDFGTRDGTAFVVWAYSDTFPGLWELYSEKRTAQPGQKLTVGTIAAWYREVEDRFGPFEGWPADWAGLATMVMDTLAAEHGVYLEPAEKREKYDHIQMFNSDLDAGLIRILRESPLATELLGDRWLEKTIGKEKRLEDPGTPNDVCDAALYAFRWCRHRQARPREGAAPRPYTPAWYADQERENMAQAIREAEAARKPQLDRDWWATQQSQGWSDPW